MAPLIVPCVALSPTSARNATRNCSCIRQYTFGISFFSETVSFFVHLGLSFAFDPEKHFGVTLKSQCDINPPPHLGGVAQWSGRRSLAGELAPCL